MNQRGLQLTVPLFVVSVLACGSGLRPVNPPSFIRPDRVAFSCVRTDKAGEPVPVPLEQCSPCKGHTGEHSLYALVTQSARGELAAVNLKARQVIDTQTTVPGYTFVAVGEAPTAIAVPTIDPTHSYVVNVGSSDLHVLDTRRLLSTRGATTATLAVIPLGRMVGGATWEQAEPVDMVLSTDEQRLVIAAPRMHALIVVDVSDVKRVVANEITAAELQQTIVPLTGLSTPVTLTTATGSDRYSVSCGIDAPHPSQPVAGRTVDVTTVDAMPVALTLDPDHNRVLVADAALPIIHAVDLATLTEVTVGGRPLFVTGVPTLDVVVSPPVPVSHDDAVYEQYIYAIDADQRGVLVMNDRGVMQSVNSVGTADRIDFGDRGALSLEVIEPGYRDCIANTPLIGPPMLRGVFLAASMVDGSIQIADIYDEHAKARCTPAPTTGAPVACSPAAPCAAIHRHRPRIATSFTAPRPCVRPLVSGGAAAALTLTALAEPVADLMQTTPSLLAVDRCDGATSAALRLVPATGSETSATIECPADSNVTADALVCVNADPWAMGAESWTATWEGAVTNDGSGVLSLDASTFDTDTMDFCRAGVLGGGATGAPVPGSFELEIIVRTAPQQIRDMFGKRDDIDCALFSARRADGTGQRFTFPITGARSGATSSTLTLGTPEPEDVPDGFTAQDVVEAARYCVAGMRFDFRIRSRGRYTVTGSRSGYLHRVVRDGSGSCAVDPTADPLREGQAIPAQRFENANIAFQIGTLAAGSEPTQDLRFSFPVATAVGFVDFDTDLADSTGVAWSIVSEIRYSPIDAQLYAVDSHVRGLLPISLSPLPSRLPSDRAFR